MSRALTNSLGAIFGLSLGLLARNLVAKVAPESRGPSKVALGVSGVIGYFVTDLILLRFSAFELRLCFAILCSGLLVQSWIDIATHRLVRQISHLMALSGFLILSFHSVATSQESALVAACVCTVAGWLIAFLSNKISRGGLGAGDVRLMAVLGWHLGFIGYSVTIWALFTACIFAGVFGLAVVVLGRGSFKNRIAFGPFLALGTVVAIFANEIVAYRPIA